MYLVCGKSVRVKNFFSFSQNLHRGYCCPHLLDHWKGILCLWSRYCTCFWEHVYHCCDFNLHLWNVLVNNLHLYDFVTALSLLPPCKCHFVYCHALCATFWSNLSLSIINECENVQYYHCTMWLQLWFYQVDICFLIKSSCVKEI